MSRFYAKIILWPDIRPNWPIFQTYPKLPAAEVLLHRWSFIWRRCGKHNVWTPGSADWEIVETGVMQGHGLPVVTWDHCLHVAGWERSMTR